MSFEFKSTYHLVILFCMFVIVLMGCKKQDSEQFQDHITAGRTSGIGIIHSGPYNISSTYQGGFLMPLNNSWNIDINKDGIYDYVLEHHASHAMGYRYWIAYILPYSEDCSIVRNGTTGDLVEPIPEFTVIDNSMNWYNGVCVLYLYNYVFTQPTEIKGLWKNKKNKYIGVRVKSGHNYCYGWISVEIEESTLRYYGYSGTMGL